MTNDTGYAAITTTVLDFDTGVYDLHITFGSEEVIDMDLAIDTYTLDGLKDAINDASMNPDIMYDADGNELFYQAASIVKSDAGTYKLRIAARDGTAASLTIAIDTQSAGNVTGIFGTKSTTGSIAVGSIFESQNTDGDWISDTTGGIGAGLNILTSTAAAAALTTVTAAISTKDSARASFGYKMNRLESTIAILDIQAENLMTAESRISDVDVATEMATLTRTQVLSQAGIAMLAQANAMPQMALTLLR
jgi:flagellin-like hook-associated protein FlgL